MRMTTDIEFSLLLDGMARGFWELSYEEFSAKYAGDIGSVVDDLMLFVETFRLSPKMGRLCAVDMGGGYAHEVSSGDIRTAVYEWLVRVLYETTKDYALEHDIECGYYVADVTVSNDGPSPLKFMCRQKYPDGDAEETIRFCELKCPGDGKEGRDDEE